MAEEKKRKRLGEILIEQGVLNQEDLKEALSIQERDGGLLGEVLTRCHMVSEEDIVVALATQFNYPYLTIENYSVNNQALKKVAAEIALRHFLIPIDVVHNIITLVMVDPSNQEAIKEVESASACKVQAFLGTMTEIQDAIKRHYKITFDEGAMPDNEKVRRTLQSAREEKEKEG